MSDGVLLVTSAFLMRDRLLWVLSSIRRIF